jgi:hypothetical protein
VQAAVGLWGSAGICVLALVVVLASPQLKLTQLCKFLSINQPANANVALKLLRSCINFVCTVGLAQRSRLLNFWFLAW